MPIASVSSAAACGELVADIIDALGVPWTRDIAANLYLAIATDTGSFRYGSITPGTFEKCRRIADTGANIDRIERGKVWISPFEFDL